jgi:multidrug efflux pump subunit AcrA (membrane-fusion protein)
VGRGDLQPRILLTGVLVAEDAMPMVTPDLDVWPMMIRWIVEDGQEVEKGDRVTEFDNSQLTSNLENVRIQALEAERQEESRRARLLGELADADAAVRQAEGARRKAELKARLPENLLSASEYRRRQLELRKAELQLEEAVSRRSMVQSAGEADLAVLQIAADEARRAYGRLESGIDSFVLRAPRDGIVLVSENRREDRTFRNGDSTWPGTVVARLPDLSTLVVHAYLSDVDDGRLLSQQSVVATLDAFPHEPLEGRVREVDGVANEVGRFSRRRAFRAVLDIDGLDPARMRPGMSVKIEALAELQENVLLIPRETLDWSQDEPRALTAGRDLVPVSLGPCTSSFCVLLDGLEGGDKLASLQKRGDSSS